MVDRFCFSRPSLTAPAVSAPEIPSSDLELRIIPFHPEPQPQISPVSQISAAGQLHYDTESTLCDNLSVGKMANGLPTQCTVRIDAMVRLDRLWHQLRTASWMSIGLFIGLVVGYALFFYFTFEGFASAFFDDQSFITHGAILSFLIGLLAVITTLLMLERGIRKATEYHGAGPCSLLDSPSPGNTGSAAQIPGPVSERLDKITRRLMRVKKAAIAIITLMTIGYYGGTFLLIYRFRQFRDFCKIGTEYDSCTRLTWLIGGIILLGVIGFSVPVVVISGRIQAITGRS